jgi:two-component system, OmpR family, phosphate regulon response regulator PhoB
VRSILYRFPDLSEFERLMSGAEDEAECEFGLPAGEVAEDGEWVLAIFELGSSRRATSAAGRAVVAPEGARLAFEPRDWRRLAAFAKTDAHDAAASVSGPPAPEPAEPAPRSPDTERSALSPARPRSAPRSAGASARVMIVDDDPDIRDVVSAMLEAVGLSVVPVSSAEDALERIRIEPFDLLVLDWNLPKMNGLELCRTLRKDEDLALLPVLFLTANASSQDMVEAFASGGDDYVVKPFRAPELGARIFSLLRRSRIPLR